MGKKKKAKPPEKKKRNIFEIRRDAHLRKLAKLLRKRERLLWGMSCVDEEEAIVERATSRQIEEFLEDQKKKK